MTPRTPEWLREQGRIAKSEHRLEDSRNLFAEALTECLRGADRVLTAVLYEELAYVERNLLNLDAAQWHYREAGEIYRSLDNPLKTAHTIRHAADILREQERPDDAAQLYAESLEIYRRCKETPLLDLANAIRGFALLKEQTGDRQEALNLWREARDLYQQTGIAAGVSESDVRIRSLRVD